MPQVQKPKIYSAKLYQTTTLAPTAVVSENTIGNIQFSYFQEGWYYLESPNAFDLDKTFIFAGQDCVANTFDAIFNYAIENPNRILLFTKRRSDGSAQDGVLYNTSFKIEVYP